MDSKEFYKKKSSEYYMAVVLAIVVYSILGYLITLIWK